MITNIQFLRGLGAIAVVLFHCAGKVDAVFHTAYERLFSFGAAGVDLFFVISGFVIPLATGRNFSVWGFARKRAVRIVPLYWLLTTLFVLILAVSPTSFAHYTFQWGWIIKSYLLLPQTPYPVLYAGWILYYIVYFYATYAFIYAIARDYCLIIIALFYLGSFVYRLSLTSINPYVYVITSDLLLEFVLGIILFKLYSMPYRMNTAHSICSIVLAVVCYLAGHDALRIISHGLPAFLLCAGIVLNNKETPWSPVCRIGDASYSVYLLQTIAIPAIAFVYIKCGLLSMIPLPMVFFLLLVVVSLGAGSLLHRYVELPISRALTRHGGARPHSSTASCMED